MGQFVEKEVIEGESDTPTLIVNYQISITGGVV